MLPQDQIGQVQNISVSPDTQVTREEKARKGCRGEDGNDGWDANRHSPLGGRQRKHERWFDKRSEETGTESGRDVRWCRDLEDEGLHCGPTLMHVANGSI